MADAGEILAPALAAFDGPMVIVTAAAGDERDGCLVGFHSQSSLEPLRWTVFVSRANRTHRVARAATHLGVHFVDVSDVELAAWFGEQTGDEVDKFEGMAWHEGPHGVPILDAVRTWFVGEIEVWTEAPGADHDAVMLTPVAAQFTPPYRPLGFQQVKGLDAAH